MALKRTPADILMSKLVRTLAGWRCMRCGTRYPEGAKGLENSHFIGRGNWSVRYDLDNCDSLCTGCHFIWGGSGREDYREYKKKSLGEDGFNALHKRSIEKSLYPSGKKYNKQWKAHVEELWSKSISSTGTKTGSSVK